MKLTFRIELDFYFYVIDFPSDLHTIFKVIIESMVNNKSNMRECI